MLDLIGKFVVCLVLTVLPITVLSNCATFANPSTVGCMSSEENACRVVAGALIVKAANITIGAQLDKGVISPAEAARARAITKQAEAAVDQARAALPLANGTTADRLAALDALLIQLLRDQVIKSGA